MAETRSPRPPGDLRAAGKALWRDVVARYELTAAELALLAEAGRCLDELGRIEVALEGVELTTTGSMGQTVAHPLLAEARAHRTVLTRLIAGLRLPHEGEEVGMSPASRQAQHAGRVRWAKHDEVTARRRAASRGASSTA